MDLYKTIQQIKQASYLERLVADGENSQCTVVGHCEQPWEIFR